MIYSTSDSIKPITITKATKSYKNCYFHKINNLRLKTDKFELPYRYSDKYNKITITMPVDNPIYLTGTHYFGFFHVFRHMFFDIRTSIHKYISVFYSYIMGVS